MDGRDNLTEGLPEAVRDYVDAVIKKMRYRRVVRQEVESELVGHFEDALHDCVEEQTRLARARDLIDEFGDPALLAKLIRRGKKRCRSLWQKAIMRGLQAACACAVLFAGYVVWFVMGDATFSVDYLKRLNEMGRPAITQQDNAWTDYERAIALYVEPDSEVAELLNRVGGQGADRIALADLDSGQWDALSSWVRSNDRAWEAFTSASTKPYCYKPYNVAEDTGWPVLFEVLLEHVPPLRNITFSGAWRARVQLRDGDVEGAIKSGLTTLRAGRHWMTRKTMVEYLVGMAISARGYESLGRILTLHDVPDGQLQPLQLQLEGLWPEGYPRIDVESERMVFLDLVQRCFTDGGPGGGHLIATWLKALEEFGHADTPAIAVLGIGLVHAGRDKTLARGNAIFSVWANTVNMSPFEQREAETDNVESMVMRLPLYRYGFIHMVVPPLGRASDRRYQQKALHEATITIVALKRWRHQKGQYPDALEELMAAGLVRALPDDPYSDTHLRYQRRGDDFVLYSVDEDFEDDGGVQTPEGAEETLDRVYWPVQLN